MTRSIYRSILAIRQFREVTASYFPPTHRAHDLEPCAKILFRDRIPKRAEFFALFINDFPFVVFVQTKRDR